MADLVVTSTQVKYVSGGGLMSSKNAGASITAGEACYLDGSTGTFKPAQSNSASGYSSTLGVAMNNAATGQPVTIATSGTINVGAGAAPVKGTLYVLSPNNPGGIAPLADCVSGDEIIVLGFCKGSDEIVLGIQDTGISL